MAYEAPPHPPPPPAPDASPPAYPAHVPPYGAYGWSAPPPGPAPGLRYAGFWVRFLAHLIDGLILAVPVGIFLGLVIAPTLPSINCTFINTTGFQSASCTGVGALFGALGLWWLVGIGASALYFVGMWTWQGQTLGQRVLGLHVVNARSGQRIDAGHAIIRYVGIIISTWVLYIGLIWAAFDPQKQGWHDKMASTFVVQRA